VWAPFASYLRESRPANRDIDVSFLLIQTFTSFQSGTTTLLDDINHYKHVGSDNIDNSVV